MPSHHSYASLTVRAFLRSLQQGSLASLREEKTGLGQGVGGGGGYLHTEPHRMQKSGYGQVHFIAEKPRPEEAELLKAPRLW